MEILVWDSQAQLDRFRQFFYGKKLVSPASDVKTMDDDREVPSSPTRSPMTLANLLPVVEEAAWSRDELMMIVDALADTDDR